MSLQKIAMHGTIEHCVLHGVHVAPTEKLHGLSVNRLEMDQLFQGKSFETKPQ